MRTAVAGDEPEHPWTGPEPVTVTASSVPVLVTTATPNVGVSTFGEPRPYTSTIWAFN